MVKCKVCGKLYRKITQSHLNTHGLSFRQYKKLKDDTTPTVIEISKSSDKVCRVCGEPYRRLSKKHLHGRTVEEYYELPPFGMETKSIEFVGEDGEQVRLDDATIDRLVPFIKDSILRRGTLSEQARNVMQSLFESKEFEFKAMVTALAMRKMERLPKLMGAIDDLDTKLCDEATFNKLTATGKMQLLKVLSVELDKIVSLFKDLGGLNPNVNLKQGDVYNIMNLSERDKDIPESAYEREKVAKLYNKIVSMLEKVRG